MKVIRFSLRILVLIVHLLAGLTVAALLFHRSNRDYHHHKSVIRYWLKMTALITGCNIQISHDSSQSIADIEGGLVIANHISWLDIFVLGGIINVRFLSKHEIRQWPLFGWLSASSGTLFIKRGIGSEQSIEQIKQALQNNDNVLIFPEATTTDGLSVKPFHPRLLKAAIDSKSPIYPLMISYHSNRRPDTRIAWTVDDHFLVTLWHALSEPRTQVQVHCFKPISTTSGLSRTELAKTCHTLIRDRLETLYD